MGKQAKRDAPKAVRRMDLDSRERLFTHLLRVPAVYSYARDKITTSLLSQIDEVHLQVLWAALTAISGRGSDHAGFRYSAVVNAVGDVLDQIDVDKAEWARPLLLDDPRYVHAGGRLGLIYRAFKRVSVSGDLVDVDVDTGLTLLRRFLSERLVADEVIRQLDLRTFGDVSQYVPTSLVDLFDHAGRQHRIVQSIGGDRFDDLVSPMAAEDQCEQFAINVPWLNDPLGGHMRSTHAYVLMGPYSGGKTMCGLNLAIEAARYFSGQAAGGLPGRHVYYFHYEVPRVEMRQRMWALLGLVHRDRFSGDGVVDIDDPRLASTERHRYEHVLADEIGVDVHELPSERDRIMRGLDEISEYFHMCKMFGDDGVGYGGLDEIQGVLEQSKDRNGWMPGMVVIDYAGLMIERELRARNMDTRDDSNSFRSIQLRNLIGRVTEMNQRFGCCAWVLHQLKGSANKRAATAQLSTSDGAGSTMMAENAHAAFALGNRDKETGCVVLHYSKCRGTPNTDRYGLVRMNDFGWFSEVSDYCLVNDRFVSRNLAVQVGAAIPPVRERPRPTTRADEDDGLPPYRVIGS